MAMQKPTTAGLNTKPAKTAPKRSSTKAATKKPTAAAKLSSASKPKSATDLPLTGELSKKELLERMVAESGMKKGEARNALNALLSVIHGALTEGKSISAAPLGKIKIARKKQTPNGELAVLRVKLRDSEDGAVAKPGKDAVADVGQER